jgi:putative transferase (TIGR04331 family)
VVSRFLITTSLEETWRDDVPVLFLGEWCRRYDRRDNWQQLNAEVVPYHWDDRKKLQQDFLYLNNLYEELLAEVSGQLNSVHEVEHSLRYWRILIGPWLGYFIQILFDRWAMLQIAVNDHEISEAFVVTRNAEDIVPNDMETFIQNILTDEWNEAIFGQLLKLFGVPIVRVPGRTDMGRSSNQKGDDRISIKRTLKNGLLGAANKLSGFLCSDEEFFFISSYLPIKQDLKLQFKLGQLPKLWRKIQSPFSSPDIATRQFPKSMSCDAKDFEVLIRAMIQRHIPKAYREGYKDLVATTKKLTWPSRPKAIFTSNSWAEDDVFKAWAAAKVERGSMLLIGQHGGNYGMARWSFVEDHQIAVADRFLTWGWEKSGRKNVIPIGNFKGFSRKQSKDKDGFALVVEMTLPQTSYQMFSAPVAHQWLAYFEDQCRFVCALPSNLRSQLLIRLSATDYGWCQKQRWRDRFASIRLDDGHQPITSLISKSRLYISTYNATTFLESMSLNIPTIIFWDTRYWELRTEAVPFFEGLKEVNIFHETPEGAAKQMANVWADVDAWWHSDAVQRVRREFCAMYAHIPVRPLDMMEKIFRHLTSQNVLSAARP